MNTQKVILILITLLIPLLSSAVTTVQSVDLNRYLGKWYQFAYYPNSFQPKDCGLTVAEYTLDKKGKILVKNTCFEDAAGKKVKKQATGKAYPIDRSNSKLKVSFFFPFKGDYWIVKLADDYRYSVVSDPKKKYLWILTRSKELSKTDYNEIMDFLRKGGWDVNKLDVTGTIR